MSLATLVVSIAVFGLIVWIILQIPAPQFVKNIIVGIAILFLVLYVLQAFGIQTGFPALRLK